MFVCEGSVCGLESRCSHFRYRACLSKEFLDVQATIECGFNLKHVRDMVRTYSWASKILFTSFIHAVLSKIFGKSPWYLLFLNDWNPYFFRTSTFGVKTLFTSCSPGCRHTYQSINVIAERYLRFCCYLTLPLQQKFAELLNLGSISFFKEFTD